MFVIQPPVSESSLRDSEPWEKNGDCSFAHGLPGTVNFTEVFRFLLTTLFHQRKWVRVRLPKSPTSMGNMIYEPEDCPIGHGTAPGGGCRRSLRHCCWELGRAHEGRLRVLGPGRGAG